MLELLPVFKDAIIQEFFHLYEQYAEDEIYGCALVFDEDLKFYHLAIATQHNLLNEYENPSQFLSLDDKWKVTKWRIYSDQNFQTFKTALLQYMHKHPQFKGNEFQLIDDLLPIYQEAIENLLHAYGLDVSHTIFLIYIANQPQVTYNSAVFLNRSNEFFLEFIQSQNSRSIGLPSVRAKKLSRADKDMLTDIAQIVSLDPFDIMHIANQTYVLTLDASFADLHPDVQKLVQAITLMDTHPSLVMQREDILAQINQFYPSAVRD